MGLYRSFTAGLAGLSFVVQAQGSSADNLQYVNQLIGTSQGGDVFGGASLPYGMAKAVADVDSSDNQGGFTSEGGDVTGFSVMHDSGTGGSPSLGLFPLFPYASCPGDDIDRCVFPKKARKIAYDNTSVVATPGYFKLTLSSGITVDMTTSQHAGLFRFQFGSTTASSPLILLDLTDLSDSRQDNASIAVDAHTGRMTGEARFQPSFGSGDYVAYFCADFQGSNIRDNGIFVDSRANASVKEVQISRSINGYPLPGGAFARFETPTSNTILARVGVSFISSDQACTNAETEIPSFNFDTTHAAAVDSWRHKLSPIVAATEGVSRDLLVNFYSGIYRTMINPQNYTGENPLWKSSEPYWDSFYCIWDLFRSQLPLLTILDPKAVESQIRSLIDTYRHLGFLPDCRMSLCKGYTQGGSNADNVIVDAYVKNLTGIDWDDAYAALIKDAEVEPYDWSNEGRGGLDSWKSLGYIPVQDFDYKGFGTMTRSISRTLEYAYNDFVISFMANALGDKGSDSAKYAGRSENWQNIFKANQTSDYTNGTSTGFTGFFQPKYLNGTWGYQDPLYCSNIDLNPNKVCSLQNTAGETFESSIWEYQFFVPHDMATLITYLGGPTTFVDRLDYLHDNAITYIGNEPSFLTVYQYHYAGRPGLSAARAHYYIPAFFGTTPDGLPGNDDSGTIGAFVALSMMGLFPNPGQDVYFIIPPFFPSVNITSPVSGRTAVIRNLNFDPSYKNIYIQSATLNGRPFNSNWLDHTFFLEGKELVLTLGSTESAWGTRVQDLPPSLGEYVGFNATANATASASASVGRRRASPMGMEYGADEGAM